MDVGIRELKLHLSEYLAHVRRGETVIVTHRGTPVARLERVPLEAPPPELSRLVEAGLLLYKPRSGRLPEPVTMLPGPKTFAEYVAEERR